MQRASRYIAQQNRILSEYLTMWPADRYAMKKGELYNLTPDAE
jgi:hypothetical protein